MVYKILIGLVLIGLIGHIINLISLNLKKRFYEQFFQDYIELKARRKQLKDIHSDKLYEKVVSNMDRMNEYLGNLSKIKELEVLSLGQINRYYDHDILLETIPKFRYFGLSDNELNTLDDTFYRFQGNLKKEKLNILKKMLNPLNLFATGIRNMIGIPIYILFEAGIINKESKIKIFDSFVFKFINFLVTIYAALEILVAFLYPQSNLIELVEGYF